MRRALALLAAITALNAAPARAGEPLDLELSRLGPPAASVWLWQMGCTTPGAVDPFVNCSAQQKADAETMAGEARVRYGRLVTDLAMAFTTALMEPASTTGYSGFQLGLEAAYMTVSSEAIGGATGIDPARPYWATDGEQPSGLLVPSVHVRKGLPYSFELGGRFAYLSQSSYFAGTLEAKWAFVEGYKKYPDFAVRVAWTKVLGPPELDLRTVELDVLVSKRFGVSPTISLTPYLAGRFTRLDASTRAVAFQPDVAPPATPDEVALTAVAFPDVKSMLYRTTLGCRMTAYAVAMALEATWFGGANEGEAQPAAGDTPRYTVPSSVSGAFKFGWEF